MKELSGVIESDRRSIATDILYTPQLLNITGLFIVWGDKVQDGMVKCTNFHKLSIKETIGFLRVGYKKTLVTCSA